MIEFKKNDVLALSDEILDEVTGGAGDHEIVGHYHCSDCKCYRNFYRDDDGKLTCEACGGHRFSGEFPHI